MHVWGILKDAVRTKSWWDKIRIWFMPTGWRPNDVKEKYPIQIIDDPYSYNKYKTESSLFLKIWSWLQLAITVALMYYMLISVGDLSFIDIVNYAIFLAISIFAYTSLMDRHVISIYAEVIKAGLGLYFLIEGNGWFGIDNLWQGASYIIVFYILISLLLSFYFQFVEKKYSISYTS